MAAPRTETDPVATVAPASNSSLHARALRHLRFVSTAYVLMLLVGTHWPRLDLSGPVGGSDKLLHFIGFGLLVFALRLAGWSVRFWAMLVWGVCATTGIEYTQSVLPIGRHWDVQDILTGMMGVVVAASITSALRPVGGRQARALRSTWMDTSWSLLARPGPCMNILVTGALAVLVGGILAIPLQGLLVAPWFPETQLGALKSLDAFVLGALGVAIPSLVVSFLVGHRSESRRLGRFVPWEVVARTARTRGVACLIPGLGLGVVLLFLFDWVEPFQNARSSPFWYHNLLLNAFISDGIGILLSLTALGFGLACIIRCSMVQLAGIADDWSEDLGDSPRAD